MPKNKGSGYESDTGPRDNPTCGHFEDNRPVTKTIDVKLGHYTRILNREGRAICRIMFSYRWSHAEIAFIFGIKANAVSRALQNTYTRRDDVSQDYSHVDPEFRIKFPPSRDYQAPVVSAIIDLDADEEDSKVGIISPESSDVVIETSAPILSASGNPGRTAKTKCLSRMEGYDELDGPEGFTNASPSTAIETTPQNNSFVAPLPMRKNVFAPRPYDDVTATARSHLSSITPVTVSATAPRTAKKPRYTDFSDDLPVGAISLHPPSADIATADTSLP
ncbi:hypothetical protein B0H15DRAFT_836757 [Mycena belliarum]|uniref:Uncharacterized protein n=1 Tax=Mycena belliarum TaxID=1033014 RepID=A0AAD6U5E3_9AGAR|nr:hypothetical protein B0H15DRAFT_836757 [Mycena belliae]